VVKLNDSNKTVLAQEVLVHYVAQNFFKISLKIPGCEQASEWQYSLAILLKLFISDSLCPSKATALTSALFKRVF